MILAGVVGAVVGSFLNVVVWRLPRGDSLAFPDSRCPACSSPVRPFDNVPIISWLALRGRCRDCQVTISPRYPLIEAVAAGAFAVVAGVRGAEWGLVLELPFVAMLIAVAAVDLEHRIVPNKILLPAALWAVAAAAVLAPADLPGHVAAGAIAFVALLPVSLANPGGMGMGDVKLAGVMGLYLGMAVVPALLTAFLAGSLVGVAMLLRHGAVARKRALPFAPFLAFGGLVSLLAGPELVDLYVKRFL